MLSVEEALTAILAGAQLTPGEQVSLDRCAGRVPVDRRLRADVDVPPFASSAMDGFALRAADVPGELPVTGEVAAGGGLPPMLSPGSAVRIMTGAPVPAGADAVVPIEDANEVAGRVRLPAVTAGSHVRPAGNDIRAGDVVELPAAPLGPAAIAVLASLGMGELAVHRRPRVAILSTGDELIEPGQPLGPGQIPDANTFSLAAAVTEAGGEPELLPRVPDDEARTEAAIRSATGYADLLVASGGVSVGRYDHVRSAIERLGSLDFWRIAVQPGKPLAFGRIGGRPVIGLPGNPVSALVTFELFVRPLIRAMVGLSGSGRAVLPARCDEEIAKDPGRRAYLRVAVERSGAAYVARSAGGQGSAQSSTLALANALLVVPEGEPATRPGATYDAVVIGGLT
ncbi:MAG TPA: gephyrin-like molybdotransferase Glp [Candidatus Limnocylindria bacterium]